MSQAIDLDFIEASLFSMPRFSMTRFSLARFSVLRLVMLAIGLIAVTITWQIYQTKQDALAILQLKQQQLNQLKQLSQVKQIPPNTKQNTVAITPQKMQQLQQTLNALAMPWNALFEAIEQAQGKDIALLSLEPDTKKQQVQITGEAKNLQAALQYVARLQMQAALSQVFLQKHTVDENNAAKPVSFSVLAKWQIARE